MTETNVPDPWANKPEINIDDGSIFIGGYDTSTFTIAAKPPELKLPNYAGYWDVIPPNDLNHFRIYRPNRPNFFHRLMNKWLIGWEWNNT